MTLFNDYYPLITGPWARALSIWIKVPVLALSLISGYGIFAWITFAVTFFAAIFDVTLCMKRHRARNQQSQTSTTLPPAYTFNADKSLSAMSFHPRKRVIVFDFIFGVLYLALWILMLLFGGYTHGRYNYSTYSNGGSYRYGASGILPAFTLIGVLTLAHVHIFFGSFETDILRKMKTAGRNSATAPMPAAVGDSDVELEAGNGRK